VQIILIAIEEEMYTLHKIHFRETVQLQKRCIKNWTSRSLWNERIFKNVGKALFL